jgi:broad specificity phosphatase PhoE
VKLVVARHCQTDLNAQHRIQGHIDAELNATGYAQAARLAEEVKGHGIAAIVSSDLRRATQTAKVVADALGVHSWADARLRECHFGSLDGVSYPEFALKCGVRNLPTASFVLQADFTPFGGERGQAVFDRQKALLDELVAEHPDGCLMIVGHGRSLRTLLAPLGHPTSWLRDQGSHLVITY